MIRKFQDSPNTNWFVKNKKNKNYKNVIKTFMGRDAIALFLENIKPKNFRVLLPGYTCNEVSLEFEKHGFDIIYYDTNNFKIDTNEIKKYLDNIDIFYYIRYFGIKDQEIDEILKYIKKQHHQILVVEDRAHYLSDNIADNVDAYIYSFRKLLPIPEGGGLLTNLPINYTSKPTIIADILALMMLFKKRFIGHNPKFSRSNMQKSSIKKYDYKNKDIPNIMLPSHFTQYLIKNFDIKKNIEFRKESFYTWHKKIKYTDGIKALFDTLGDSDIPQGFPIIVKDADKLHEDMFTNEGIYLKRHWVLNEKFKSLTPKAYNLSKRVITLPIYEGINSKDMDFIIEKVKKYV